MGRFITEDPYWNINNMIYGDSWNSDNPQINTNAIMQSSNLYAYCINNPMTYIDTNGNFLLEATVVVVVVLGAGLAYFDICNYTKSNLENGNVGFNISDSDYIKLKKAFDDYSLKKSFVGITSYVLETTMKLFEQSIYRAETNEKVDEILEDATEGRKTTGTMSLGLEYEEEFIRYRLECKEEFKRLSAVEIIPKMYNQNARNVDGGLYEWMAGENSLIHTKQFNFLKANGVQGWEDKYEMFFKFIQKYDSEYAKIENLENDIEAINEKIRALIEVKNSIKTFWKYKPTVNEYYEMLNKNELNDIEKNEYINIVNAFINAKEVLENAKVEFNLDKDVYSFNAVQNVVDELLNEKRALTKEKLEAKYNFQTWENIKYNLKLRYSVDENVAIDVMQARQKQEQQKEQKKEERKNKIKGFLGL